MSDRIIVATFSETNAAYETARAMKDLKKAGTPGTADFKRKTATCHCWRARIAPFLERRSELRQGY
jgi:hypothetical protein